MKVREALRTAAFQLSQVSETPRLDAELLMAKALGVEREAVLLSRLDDPAPAAFDALVARRLAHEPVAYITGRRAFWTIELEVAPGVLIPRPDSETLIEAAVAHFGAGGPKRVLDLGTGSGALLLAALDQWPGASGIGVDASEAALAIASRNAERLGLGARACFERRDWAEGLEERFDLILCNPPYVEQDAVLPPEVAQWEPASALFAGADGLDAYRRLAPVIRDLLSTEGIACFEIGCDQGSSASAIFQAEGLKVELRSDLAGRARCLVLRG